MEKNVDELARARNAARGAMVAEREARREQMRAVAEGKAGGRLAAKLSAVMLDQDVFDGWVVEKGGLWKPDWTLREAKEANAELFMGWFCAQISSGVTAVVLCRDYCQEMGLLGAFVSEKPERMEQYKRAKMWRAEGLVDEAYGEAWDDGPDVVRSGLRVKTNMQIAGKYNRAEYGEEKQSGVPGVPIFNVIMPGAVVPEGAAELPPLIQAED